MALFNPEDIENGDPKTLGKTSREQRF